MEEVQQVYLPYDSADSLLLWLSLQPLFVVSDLADRRDVLSLNTRIVWLAFVYSQYGKCVCACVCMCVSIYVCQRRSQDRKVEEDFVPFVVRDLWVFISCCFSLWNWWSSCLTDAHFVCFPAVCLSVCLSDTHTVINMYVQLGDRW